MKTKNKILAVLEIAIVLCSMFLVALPAIAANQTTQKVSASEVTAASEFYEPGPLDVFGNANEDDTIDMRDTTYIKLVIFGKKPKTDLADANYDGKVSMLDVGQAKLIILGKEKKLTYIDIFGEAETVNKPIERLAQLGLSSMQVTRMLGAWNIIVCVATLKGSFPIMYPDEISKLPAVGNKPDSCDHEMILSLKPDAVMTNLEARFAASRPEQKRMFKEKLPGIPIICLNMREMDALSENVRTYGYILDREDEAEEFIDWYEGYYNVFKSRTEELSEDEKPRVIYENNNKPYQCIATGSRFGQALFLAGGYNIVDEIVGPGHPQYGTITVDVDPEWVIEQNPEIIFIRGRAWLGCGGYGTDDPSEFAALRQKILDRPELANVDAVKNKHVYVQGSQLLEGAGCGLIGIAYMGKLFQPDLFIDIDPQAVHQEYLDMFCHIDFDVRKHGVFFYPPIEEW